MTNHECMSLFGVVLVSELPSSKQDSVEFILVFFSLTQIERSAIFGRETGVPGREIFSRQNIFNFSVKNCYLQQHR